MPKQQNRNQLKTDSCRQERNIFYLVGTKQSKKRGLLIVNYMISHFLLIVNSKTQKTQHKKIFFYTVLLFIYIKLRKWGDVSRFLLTKNHPPLFLINQGLSVALMRSRLSVIIILLYLMTSLTSSSLV